MNEKSRKYVMNTEHMHYSIRAINTFLSLLKFIGFLSFGA